MPNLPGYYGISMTKYRPIISIYGKQVGNTYYSATSNTREQVVSFLPSLNVANYLHCANLVIIITLNIWEIFYFLQNWYFAKDTWMLSFCHCHAQSSSPCTLCLARFFLYSLMSSDSFFSSPHFWLFLILKLCIEVPSRLVIPITLSTRFFLYHHFLLFVEQIFHLGSI